MLQKIPSESLEITPQNFAQAKFRANPGEGGTCFRLQKFFFFKCICHWLQRKKIFLRH